MGYLKYGKRNVVPFTSKRKAKKFMAKTRKQGYKPTATKYKNIYLVMARAKRYRK